MIKFLLILLFIVSLFVGQTWSYAATTLLGYAYDASTYSDIERDSEFGDEEFNYDGSLISFKSRDVLQSQPTGDKFLDGSLFVLFGDFIVVTKGAFSKVAPATTKQLQKKFKHAGDFGVTGNYNPANAQKFNQAIQRHLYASGTKEISGAYRGNPATFHTNPNSGLTVIQSPNGSFLSGWKLNPQQLQHVLKDGKL